MVGVRQRGGHQGESSRLISSREKENQREEWEGEDDVTGLGGKGKRGKTLFSMPGNYETKNVKQRRA